MSPRDDRLAARLFVRSEVEKLSTDRLPGFLEEFPLGGGQQVFALVRLPFGIDQAPSSFFAQNGPPGWTSRTCTPCGRLR